MIAVRDLQIGDFINTENNGVVQITVLSWRGFGYVIEDEDAIKGFRRAMEE